LLNLTNVLIRVFLLVKYEDAVTSNSSDSTNKKKSKNYYPKLISKNRHHQ